jgi:template-activating factor I
MSSGKKRASPGADEEKSPLQNITLGDEDAQKLQAVQKDINRAELDLGTSQDGHGCRSCLSSVAL